MLEVVVTVCNVQPAVGRGNGMKLKIEKVCSNECRNPLLTILLYSLQRER
jgi:hypothetical protein